MGPTNVALVKLSVADKAWRAAIQRLDAASHNVRVQERRLNDLKEKLNLAQATLREQQGGAAQFDLEVKSHDDRIERFRTQQQNARNNKEYQAFLVEINTAKADKSKSEEDLIKFMEEVDKGTKEVQELQKSIDEESRNLTANQQALGGKLAALQAEIDALKPARDQAAATVPGKALEAFERLAERYEDEAMVPISKPDRRREEYICSACNMALVTDIYNLLHARDELVFCPNCRKILYIPNDLPPELAIGNGRGEGHAKGSGGPRRRKAKKGEAATDPAAPTV